MEEINSNLPLNSTTLLAGELGEKAGEKGIFLSKRISKKQNYPFNLKYDIVFRKVTK